MRDETEQEFKLTNADYELYAWAMGGKSSFMNNLFQAMSKADTVNLSRLSRGFPEEVDAYRRYTREAGYWDSVRNRIEG